MSAHTTPAASHDDPGPQGVGSRNADTQGYREVLHDLIHLGADLARCLHGQTMAQAAQATAHPATVPGVPNSNALISLILAFDRIARTVRRGILLARSLDKPVQPAPDPAHAAAQARAAARRQVIRAVEDAIQRPDSTASDGRDPPETLHAELRERLDGPDLDCDIGTRPTADIIAEICRDLGIAALPGTRPWKRRTPEDIRQLCAQAAAASSTPQPGAGPQAPRPSVTPPNPDPQPDKPAAVPRAQPGPIQPGSNPPEDPAETLAMILRHPAPVQGRWRPPPHT